MAGTATATAGSSTASGSAGSAPITGTIVITQLDDTTANLASDDAINNGIDVDDYLGVPAGVDWAAIVAANGLGYSYPEQTQGTSYRTGDAKNIEDTIFGPVRDAQGIKAVNTMVDGDFLTLNENNSFGNTLRVTDDTGAEIYTNKLLIDHITGLMWYTDLQTTATWDNAIDAALASTQSSFSDWFVPSVEQILSIFRFGAGADIGYGYAPFSIATGTQIQTSTTDPNPTTSKIATRGIWNAFLTGAKSASLQYLLCRKY